MLVCVSELFHTREVLLSSHRWWNGGCEWLVRGLRLVGGAFKNASAQAHPRPTKHKLGVRLASWYFSKVALVILMNNSGQKWVEAGVLICQRESSWALSSVFFFSKNKSCHCLHYFSFSSGTVFMGRNFKCFFPFSGFYDPSPNLSLINQISVIPWSLKFHLEAKQGLLFIDQWS